MARKIDVYAVDGSHKGYYLVLDQGVVAFEADPEPESAEFASEREAEAWLRGR